MIDMRDILAAGGPDYAKRSKSRIRRLSIHHWGPPELPADSVDAEYAWLLRIRDFHRNTRQWPGYAYHFTIFPSGRIYYTGDIETLRYVVGDGNGENLAIALAGDFTNNAPTDAAIHSVVRLIPELNFDLDAIRRMGGLLPVLGHKETPGTEPTACPGNTWPLWKDRIVHPDTDADPVDPGDGSEEWANIQRAIRGADQFNLKRRYVLGCAVAEGGLLNANRRPKNPAHDEAFWPDVSEGVLQQTVAWSVEYQDEGGDPWTYPGPDVTERILALYRDPEHAFRMALPRLADTYAEAGNDLDGLCLYNAPWIEPIENPNRGNYTRGLIAADRILGGENWREVMQR